jgi:Na+-transporting NADH:ubiquinone oxidoreductase subunit NqrB
MFVDSYGVGIGLGTFRVENNQIIHNTALWLLVEMSIAGLALYCALVVVPATDGLRLALARPGIGAPLLAAHFSMVATSATIEASYQRHWWVVIGMIAGGLHLVGGRSTSPAPSSLAAS